MLLSLLASLRFLDCLYAIPLVFATGFVYSASRHENFQEVIHHGLRLSAWIGGFMLASLIVMLVLF